MSVPPETSAKPALHQHLAHRLGVVDDVLGVDLEVGAQRLAEGHGLGGDDVHQRAALDAGEDRRVDLLGDVLVVGQDHAAARTAQRLVRRRGDDVSVRERARMLTAGNEAGEVRHVDHESARRPRPRWRGTPAKSIWRG